MNPWDYERYVKKKTVKFRNYAFECFSYSFKCFCVSFFYVEWFALHGANITEVHVIHCKLHKFVY